MFLQVLAVFVELHIPTGIVKIAIDASGRYEKHAEFMKKKCLIYGKKGTSFMEKTVHNLWKKGYRISGINVHNLWKKNA